MDAAMERMVRRLTLHLGLREERAPLDDDFMFQDSTRGMVRIMDAMLDRIEALESKPAGKK